MKRIGVVWGILLLLVGCGGKPADISVKEEPASGEIRTQMAVVDPVQAATLRGKVFFDGQAPAPAKIPIRGNPECSVFHPDGVVTSEELLTKDGALRNVFVYVKEGFEGQKFTPPSETVTIENKNCVYVPHVSGAQVEQPVVLLNDDPTLHNIHSYSKNSKAFNLGLPFQGMKQTKKFQNPEVMVTLKCDVHPWMIGYLGVLPHPYFAVTSETGEFEIKNLPAGEYTLEAWHERLGAQSQKIKIEPRETKEIQFNYKM